MCTGTRTVIKQGTRTGQQKCGASQISVALLILDSNKIFLIMIRTMTVIIIEACLTIIIIYY